MTTLKDLSDLQETYRGLFRDTYREDRGEVPADLNEEDVVAVAVIHHEMAVSVSGDPYIEPEGKDIMLAIEFLDHLDTLGKMITGKP